MTVQNVNAILDCIRANDLLRPMQILIAERIRMAALNRPVAHQSIYRDLIFLSFLGLGRQNIDLSKSRTGSVIKDLD